MVTDPSPFVQAEPEMTKKWYQWTATLNNLQNPFSPTDAGKNWNVNQTDQKLIWLAGITATTEPAYKPVPIPNPTAIVERSAAVVYNDGKGNPVQREGVPKVVPREISLELTEHRDLYLPIDTELAIKTKYPNVTDLPALAKALSDKENNQQDNPPASVTLNKVNKIDPAEIKNFAVEGDNLDLKFDKDNVFMFPPGEGIAAFYDYAVILKNEGLKEGRNELIFGVKGKYFDYTVTYNINKGISSKG